MLLACGSDELAQGHEGASENLADPLESSSRCDASRSAVPLDAAMPSSSADTDVAREHGDGDGGPDAAGDAAAPAQEGPQHDGLLTCPEGKVACSGICIDAIPTSADAIVRLILRPSCARLECHGGAAPLEGLDLASADSLMATALDRPSRQVPALSLIRPGDPYRSYLMRKLRDSYKYGTAMPPPPEPLLCQAKVEAVEAWIRAGAPR